MERTPLEVEIIEGIKCGFCGNLFRFRAYGYKQVFVSEDGEPQKDKRGKKVGDLVYRCVVCKCRGIKKTVDEKVLIELKVKEWSDQKKKAQFAKEVSASAINDLNAEFWESWKP